MGVTFEWDFEVWVRFQPLKIIQKVNKGGKKQVIFEEWRVAQFGQRGKL